MDRPPRPPAESLFARGLWQHVVWVGLMIAGLCIFSQAYAIRSGSAHWQTIVFTVLTVSQMAQVMAVRSDTESLWRLGLFSNLPLVGAATLTVGLQMAVIYWPPFQLVFKTAALSAGELLFTLALCSLVLIAVEIEKWLSRRSSQAH
jgi:Ca2+-transporting ATPase